MAKKVKSDKKGKKHKILSDHTLERTVGGAVATSAAPSSGSGTTSTSATMPSTSTVKSDSLRRR